MASRRSQLHGQKVVQFDSLYSAARKAMRSGNYLNALDEAQNAKNAIVAAARLSRLGVRRVLVAGNYVEEPAGPINRFRYSKADRIYKAASALKYDS